MLRKRQSHFIPNLLAFNQHANTLKQKQNLDGLRNQSHNTRSHSANSVFRSAFEKTVSTLRYDIHGIS